MNGCFPTIPEVSWKAKRNQLKCRPGLICSGRREYLENQKLVVIAKELILEREGGRWSYQTRSPRPTS